MDYLSKSEEETKKIAYKFAKTLKGGEVIALVGDLGAGKTTFIQGLGDALGINRIISPTFIIMRKYELKDKNFYHIDLYRLEEALKTEITNLGVFDILGKKDNIIAIEWADKIKDHLPPETIWIKFKSLRENKRKIQIL